MKPDADRFEMRLQPGDAAVFRHGAYLAGTDVTMFVRVAAHERYNRLVEAMCVASVRNVGAHLERNSLVSA